MAIRKIHEVGDPCLTKVCRPVTEFNDRLHELLDDMADTLEEAGGVGLAAPQVGIGLRTFHYEAVIPGAVFVRSGIEPQRQRLLRQFHYLVGTAQPIGIRSIRRESASGEAQPQCPGLVCVKGPFLTSGWL